MTHAQLRNSLRNVVDLVIAMDSCQNLVADRTCALDHPCQQCCGTLCTIVLWAKGFADAEEAID